jgi:hypothetical protein
LSQIKGIAGITHPLLGEDSRNEPGIWQTGFNLAP